MKLPRNMKIALVLLILSSVFGVIDTVFIWDLPLFPLYKVSRIIVSGFYTFLAVVAILTVKIKHSSAWLVLVSSFTVMVAQEILRIANRFVFSQYEVTLNFVLVEIVTFILYGFVLAKLFDAQTREQFRMFVVKEINDSKNTTSNAAQ